MLNYKTIKLQWKQHSSFSPYDFGAFKYIYVKTWVAPFNNHLWASYFVGSLALCLGFLWDSPALLLSRHAFFYPYSKRTLIFPWETCPSFSASFVCGDGPPLHLPRQGQWDVRRNLVGLRRKPPGQYDVKILKIRCWVTYCYHKGSRAQVGAVMWGWSQHDIIQRRLMKRNQIFGSMTCATGSNLTWSPPFCSMFFFFPFPLSEPVNSILV